MFRSTDVGFTAHFDCCSFKNTNQQLSDSFIFNFVYVIQITPN